MRQVLVTQDGATLGNPIEVGSTQQARDPVSGFSGTVVAVCVHDTGSIRIQVQPRVGADGKLPDAAWFDLERLNLL